MRFLVALLLLCPTLLRAQTRYASEALQLRAGASDKARALTTIPARAAVAVRDCDRAEGEWCLVTFEGQRGFVPARLLDADDSAVGPLPLSSALPSGSSNRSGTSSRAQAGSGGAATDREPRASSRSSAAARGYFRGPRGGCYTITATGRKRYVDHSYCTE
jgi:hypothetical protein